MKPGTFIQCANDQYEIIHQEGRGNYGIVYKAKRKSDNKIVAIKMPIDKDIKNNLYSTQQKEKTLAKIKGEIQFLKTIASQAEDHHIIPLWDWHDGSDDHYPMMVMPFCEGTLSHFCRDTGDAHSFNCQEWLGFIEQILIALSFMRETKTESIHRDVKIDNLLMIEKKVYLSDFGTFKELKRSGTSSLAGTIEWGAPEQFIPEKIESGDPYYRLTDKADIYPVGLIMYMLLSYRGMYPKAQTKLESLIDAGGRCLPNSPAHFQKIGGLEDHEKTNCIKYLTQLTQKSNLPFPDEFIQACIQFIESLLCPIIEKRPDAKTALNQLKQLQDMIYPQITLLKVSCPKSKIPIHAPIVLHVNAKGKGLPSIDKCLAIYEQTNKNSVPIQSKRVINKNQWELTLPGISQEGTYTFTIKTYNANKSVTCSIQVYATPAILWKQKRYEEALLHEDDEHYPGWLQSIEKQASQSKEACQSWLKRLDNVHKHISIFKRPDLFVLIGRLIEMKEQPLEEKVLNAPNKKKEKSGGLFSWIRSPKNEESQKKNQKSQKIIQVPRQEQVQLNDEDIIQLRSQPQDLSEDDVKAMIKRFNFSDQRVNKSGQFKNDYVDNQDGTITDKKTGLMWQQGGSDDRMTINNIKKYIRQLNKQKYAGYTDWRVPTVEELMSLMENKELNGDLYIDPIFSKKQRWCLTSDKRSSSSRWVVSFNYGSVYWNDWHTYYVRAVRLGQ